MAGPRMKKARVRDKGMCGVHLGGCGQLVSKEEERSLDHIIPKAWFRSASNGTASPDYNDVWNRQLMHKTCDNEKKAVTSTVCRNSGATVIILKSSEETCSWLFVIPKPPKCQRDT